MSWLDLVKRDLIITTGDGKKYTPSYLNARRGKDFNVAEFEFSELDGTLVKRSRPKGRRYPLELYFTGADHLDKAAAFDISSSDSRPWKLDHPYYGILYVQPTATMDFDNSIHNVTRITTTVMETILDDAPRVRLDPIEQVKLKKKDLDTTFTVALKAKLKPVDINVVSAAAKKNYKFSVPIIKIPSQFTAYTNVFNTAMSAVNNATASPLLAMRTLISLASYPATFQQNVKGRVDLLKTQFETFRDTIKGSVTLAQKQLYQNMAGSIVSSIAIAAVSPFTGDYKNNREVYDVIDALVDAFNAYLDDLDLLQTDNGAMVTSFVPDPASLVNLSQLMSSTIGSLFSIAFNARKEKTMLTEKDTNIILLTHRFYGLDADDNNIQEFVNNNNFSLSERLIIKKGRKIVYYV